MPESQFANAYHLLQSESPVFFTALNLFGLMTVNLTTEPEVENLIALYPPESRAEIAKIVGVSGESVQSKTDA
jgi:hypothetical protein